jgi:hypothetical protein
MGDHYRHGRGTGRPNLRGPYGTNIGDTWMAPGSEIQSRLDQDGDGLQLCIFINEDGEQAMFTTANPELIAEARAGHELWVAEQASRN